MLPLLATRPFALIVIAMLALGCDSRETGTPVVQPVEIATEARHAARGDVVFVDGYEAGYRSAIASGKPMLVFFTADWCAFCQQMADGAFRQPDIVELSGRFVCVLVDADDEPGVCRRFRVPGYPTVQFISPRGVPLNRLVGRQPAARLGANMQTALDISARETDPAINTVRRWRTDVSADRPGMHAPAGNRPSLSDSDRVR